MKILYAASEVAPFAKTGGLADVAGSLPAALAKLGHDVRIIMPRYGQIDGEKFGLKLLLPEMKADFPGNPQTGCVMQCQFPGAGLPVYFIGHDGYFNRGGLYQDGAVDYPDNAERFGFFCMAAIWALAGLDWQPEVICCNDWQTALIPTFLRNLDSVRARPEFSRIKCLFTIHNLAYQGSFDRSYVERLGLPPSVFCVEGLEFYGNMNLMKAGIVYSDKITTVSPRYAQEIQTEEFGCGLEGVLQARAQDLTGILNGIDPAVWSPEADPLIPAKYSVKDLAGKAKCKAHLQKKCGLTPSPDVPLIGVISRLAEQKGFDLVAEAAPQMMNLGVQFVLLGTGEPKLHELFAKIARDHPQKASVYLTFDNTLAHEIEAGADMFLMPSRYEPCGLNQFYSLRYGTIPIVRKTGGLADSIVNYSAATSRKGVATGFVFEKCSAKAMLGAIKKAVDLYRRDSKAWTRLRLTAMKQDFTWTASAREYDKLLQAMAAEQPA